MADKVKTTNSLNYTLNYDDGSSRNFSIDVLNTSNMNETVYEAKNLRDSLTAGYKYALQPTGWRDSDTTEDAKMCTSCELKLVQKTETMFDVG